MPDDTSNAMRTARYAAMQLAERLSKAIDTYEISVENLKAQEVSRRELEKAMRNQIAADLLKSRRRLRYLKSEVSRIAAQYNRMLVQNEFAFLAEFNIDYKPVPTAKVKATRSGAGLPAVSGVYFVWRDNMVVYVGQTTQIASRAQVGSHAHIEEGMEISWLAFPIDDLNYAEALYIGLLRPIRNFGAAAENAAGKTVASIRFPTEFGG